VADGFLAGARGGQGAVHIAQQVARQRFFFRRRDACRVFGSQGIEQRRHRVGIGPFRQLAGRDAAHGRQRIERGTLQRHLVFQALGQHCAHGIEFFRQDGTGGDDFPQTVQLGNLVGIEFFFLRQLARRSNGGFGLALLGLLMAQGVEAALHEFGDTAVGVAHGLLDFFQHGLGVHMGGRRQAHIGEFALQDQFDRARLIGFQRLGPFQLSGTAGSGLFSLGGIGCGSGGLLWIDLLIGRLVAGTLEEEFEHNGLPVDQKHHHSKVTRFASVATGFAAI